MSELIQLIYMYICIYGIHASWENQQLSLISIAISRQNNNKPNILPIS